MPYIKVEERTQYFDLVNSLLSRLKKNDNNPGHINYIISKLVNEIFKSNKCYAEANKLMGVLSCVQAELYRRGIGEYENIKLKENKDI